MTTSAAAKKRRPKYLSLPAILFEIRLPWSARVSILHRISGALLVFPLTAWLLFMLDASLASEQGFEEVRGHYLQLPLVKLGLIVFAWAFFHHLFAGIRFLLLDLDKGIELRAARTSALVVLVASLLLTLVFAAAIW